MLAVDPNRGPQSAAICRFPVDAACVCPLPTVLCCREAQREVIHSERHSNEELHLVDHFIGCLGCLCPTAIRSRQCGVPFQLRRLELPCPRMPLFTADLPRMVRSSSDADSTCSGIQNINCWQKVTTTELTCLTWLVFVRVSQTS